MIDLYRFPAESWQGEVSGIRSGCPVESSE